ncbi:class I SAM-dependent methyltransferase [Tenacibaculum sp. IB213877]|uniref:class I SAM-dependent methyltransferase n=1 Tax=Tenacibaculum sp. IB213877 TaxID=3097351 RepID=UPI002A5ABC0A|nr:class I SAM-dependent methyltransferase [Tenacibaculum sp. IB213877]MDY0780480.1 class I SAM-dependent methyltransferase [Tenacibaculum sp. IB213877]
MTQSELEKNLQPFLICRDHTVSQQDFKVMTNEEWELLVTQPIPENLGDFYKSEDYISHTDSKKTLIDKLYQAVRNHTLKKKLKLINSFKTESKSLLDIGSGTGDFLITCKNNGWQVKGVEPNEKARNISLTKNLVINSSLEEIKHEKFDVITLWHVLEHVPNLIEYITKIKSLLKDDGVLIIAVPNYKSYDAKYYKQFWAAYDVPRHVWHFSKNSIKKIFSDFNMKLEKVLPMKFDSFYVSLLSEKYKTGKMNSINAFYQGLLSNLKAISTKEYSSHIYILKKH